MSVTVLTATLPERTRLFAELADSLSRQTLPPARWLVQWDWNRQGPAKVLNKLAAEVKTEWLFRIDDDDLLEHDHFDQCAPYLTSEFDVVYSWPRVEGNAGYPTIYQHPFNPDELLKKPGLPSVAFIRTELWNDLDGYNTDPNLRHEDWDFWVRAIKAGARFLCLPIVTWTYRLGDWEHKSR